MNISRRLLLLCFIWLSAMTALRAEVKVSVLTCSPGDEVYSVYGHTALRYRDTSKNLDVVFNYGCFDFSSPNFIWRFVLGETDYLVCVTDYRDFVPEYEMRGSSIVEQVLELSDDEATALFDALLVNIRPENRVYRYRYLDNNCTTKVRDMILKALGDSVNIAYKGDSPSASTYRDALNSAAIDNPWYSFGINLLLGADVDKEPSREAMQFLPLNFMSDLDGAYIVSGNGMERKLVRESNLLLREDKPAAKHNNFTPFNASLLLLLATFVTMLCELRKRKTYWGLDVLLMSVQGVAGLLLLFMALFSEHPAVGNNWLLLLLNPLALLLLPIMLVKIKRDKSLKIVWVQVVFVVAFLLSALLGPQIYPAPIYFCALALLARSLFHIYKDRICELNIV